MARKDKTVDYYRVCFSTESGKKVLANLLIEARFFEYTHTPEEQAVENFVKTILTKMGGYDIKNAGSYIEGFLGLPYKM